MLSLLLKSQHPPHPSFWWLHFLLSREELVTCQECPRLPASVLQNVCVPTYLFILSPCQRKKCTPFF
jgi:hypothetical protein